MKIRQTLDCLKTFPFLSFGNAFGRAFIHFNLWIRRSINDLLDLTHSENMSSSTSSLMFWCISQKNPSLFQKYIPSRYIVVPWIYVNGGWSFGDYNGWFYSAHPKWHVQMGYSWKENRNNYILGSLVSVP